MTGVLPNAEAALAANSVHQVSIGMCFYFSRGISMAASTRVSNALGASNARDAKLATTCAVVVCAMMTSVIATIVLLSRNVYWHVFTRDPALGALITRNMLVLAVYAPLDGMCCVLAGVIRGVGLQRKGAPCVVFSYYAVGLPTSWYLAFGPGRSLGIPRVMSLCVGGAVGTAMHTLLFAVLVWRIDWREEASARSRLGNVANVAAKLLASSARARAKAHNCKQTAPLADGLLSNSVGLTAVQNPVATLPSSEHGYNAEPEFEAPPLASSMAKAANAEPAWPPPLLVAGPDEPASSAGATTSI